MLKAKMITWIDEPSDQPNKSGHYPRYVSWPYKHKDIDCNFSMNEKEHKVYIAEVAYVTI